MRQSFNTIRSRVSSVALASLITTSAAQANTYEETLYDMDEILPKAEQFQSYRTDDFEPEAYDVTSKLTLTGNTWKSLDIPNVTVDHDTFITFDFKAETEGEIQAILPFPAHQDIADNNDHHNPGTIIRLQGTQNYDHAQSPLYSQHGDWQRVTIPLTNYVGAGTEIDQLVFINDDDQYVGADSSFRNLRIYETTEDGHHTLMDMDNHLFHKLDLVSYRTDDFEPEAYDVTSKLTLTGNTWKSLDIPNVTVDHDTFITFDYKAETEGEIQAILPFPAHQDIADNNDHHNPGTIIRLQGTQNYHHAQSPLYSQHGDWQSVTAPLTNYVSAGTEIDHLVFINDDDQYVGADSSFRNLRIYTEKENQNPVTGEDNLMMQENSTAKIDVLANDFDPDGDTLTISEVRGAINGSAAINADNTVTFTPSDGFTGSTSFEYVVSDGKGGTNFQTVNVSVLENNDDDGGSDPGTGGGSDGGSDPDTTHYSLTTEFLVCDTDGLCSKSNTQVHDVEKTDQNDNTVTLSWIRPHRRENGDCLPPEELEIYHGSYETDTGLSQDFSFYTSETYCDYTGDVDLDCNLQIQQCEKELIIE